MAHDVSRHHIHVVHRQRTQLASIDRFTKSINHHITIRITQQEPPWPARGRSSE